MKFKNNKIACFILRFLYDGITKFYSIKIGKNKNSSHFQVPQNILSIEAILLKSSLESLYEPSIQSLTCTCIVKIATISLQLRFTTFDFPSSSCPKIDCTKLQLAESCISQEKRIESGNITDFSNVWHFKLYYYKGYNPMTLFSTTQIQISPLNHT